MRPEHGRQPDRQGDVGQVTVKASAMMNPAALGLEALPVIAHEDDNGLLEIHQLKNLLEASVVAPNARVVSFLRTLMRLSG